MNTGIKKEYRDFNRLYKFCFWAAIICSGTFLLFHIFVNTNIIGYFFRNKSITFFDIAVFVFAACTALLTIVAVYSSKLSIRLTACPILRLTVKTTCNKIILYAENVGNGTLFLEGFGGSSCCDYNEMVEKIYIKCKNNKLTLSRLNMDGVTRKCLAKGESLPLLRIKNSEAVKNDILTLLDNNEFIVKFTDMLGEKYEERIKPEIYKYKERQCPQA